MNYNRIVFVTRLSAIGDAIIASHAIQLLAANGYYPVFVTSKAIQAIAESMPYLHSTIYIDKGVDSEFYVQNKITSKEAYLAFLKTISVTAPPIFLDLQKTSRSKRAQNEIKKIIRLEQTYSVSKRTLYRFFLIVLAFLCFSQRKKKKNLDLKSVVSIQTLQENIVQKIVAKDGKPWIPPPLLNNSLDINHFDKKNYGDNTVCLFPGASGFVKMWPKENFRDLMDLILNSTDWTILLCGASSELNVGEYLDFPKNERVVNLIGKTNLKQTLNFIAKARYIVTNDSFPAHAAHAFGIPATVLFGATSPKFGFAPVADNIKIEYANLACSPCTRHGKSSCPYLNLKCLSSISAEVVFASMKTSFELTESKSFA